MPIYPFHFVMVDYYMLLQILLLRLNHFEILCFPLQFPHLMGDMLLKKRVMVN